MKIFRLFGQENIEGAALSQFHDALQQAFVVKGALMPNAHASDVLPIGAVVATAGKIVPSWIGHDIGCGMCAILTSFSREGIEANKQAIFDQVYRNVPTGFAHNSNAGVFNYKGDVSAFVKQELLKNDAPARQIGTLGGGNSFIEIGYDECDRVWIVIHSGSRNVGHKIATHYMKLASGDGKAREGYFALNVDSLEGADYIKDLAFGLEFALNNRLALISRVQSAINQAGVSGGVVHNSLINRSHNHAEERLLPICCSKDGHLIEMRKVWIHRKGSTHAEDGMMGVILGNMLDGSFIVRGKGNPDSLYSSSHGAGRILSRTDAKETLDKTTMVAQGIQARVEQVALDESPMAYKNIFEVMAMQRDLVDVVHHIKPLINIKGGGVEC